MQEGQFSHGDWHRHTPPQIQRSFDLCVFVAAAGCAGDLPDIVIRRVERLPSVEDLDHKVNDLVVPGSALCNAANGSADGPSCL